MATDVDRRQEVAFGRDPHHWVVGSISGLLAGAVFGAMMGAGMMETVAATVGMEGNVAVGWTVHSIISVVFAAVYVAAVSFGQLAGVAARPSTGGVVGAAYGIVVWVGGAVVLMPVLVTGSFAIDPNWASLVGHVVWGVALGVLYPVLLAHE